MKKTYIVVRADLPPGLQMAQACHAAVAFTAAHGVLTENLVVLHAPDERALRALSEGCGSAIRAAAFHEPDLGGELTALAMDDGGRRLLSSLPLALRAA